MGRSNPANLIEINGTRIILDCGMGVSHQLAAAKVPLTSVKHILISHHHSDHNLEYGNLVYNAWATGLSTPIHSFGPKGLEEMTKTYWELNKFDVDTRIADEGRPDPRPLLMAKDIDGNGEVLKTDDFTITAFRTPHPPITDNFAYKFTTPDGVVVFSSDTEYNPKLAEFAKGADVLVHEALYAPFVDKLVARVKNGATLGKHLLASHTTAQDVGKIAAAANVKLLVLSHLVSGRYRCHRRSMDRRREGKLFRQSHRRKGPHGATAADQAIANYRSNWTSERSPGLSAAFVLVPIQTFS